MNTLKVEIDLAGKGYGFGNRYGMIHLNKFSFVIFEPTVNLK